VGRRQPASRGEDLLDIRASCGIRDVNGRLLEDDVVERERILDVVHERELVDETLVIGEGLNAVVGQVLPTLDLIGDGVSNSRGEAAVGVSTAS
jgi:hypothetical protein